MLGFFVRMLRLAVKIAIVVGGIAVIISYARLSEYGDMRKSLMERILNSYAGRIAIDGDTKLNLTFPPSVTIDNLKIKNAKWAKKPNMLTAKQVVAEVDLLPLLRGQMAVPRLRMMGVDIIVQRGPDGMTNWDELNNFNTAAGPSNPAVIPTILPQVAGASLAVVGGTLTVLNTLGQVVSVVSFGGSSIIGGGIPCL